MSKKFKRWIIFGISISLILVIGGPIFLVWYKTPISKDVSYGVPELLYFSTQILMSFFTLLAVIVAIFGQDISNLFHGERCSISLESNNFVENLGESRDAIKPEAQSYSCNVRVVNIGSVEISECQLIPQKVEYKETEGSKYRTISSQFIPLYWHNEEQRSYNLLTGASYVFPLSRIVPMNFLQTPDSNITPKPKLIILGCKLGDRYDKKGIWRIEYLLRSRKKRLLVFNLTIRWNGEWYGRISEMKEVANINMEVSEL